MIAGMDGNDLLLAFDIRVGSGRQSYKQTWVVRRVFSPQPAPPWPSNMLFREIGNWKGAARKAAFFRSARMNMAQIEETWELLR